MVAVLQVEHLVDNGVFEHGLRCEDQLPVEMDLTVLAAAAPHVFLVLDLNAPRPQSVALAMLADKIAGIVAHAAFQPQPECALDDGI